MSWRIIFIPIPNFDTLLDNSLYHVGGYVVNQILKKTKQKCDKRCLKNKILLEPPNELYCKFTEFRRYKTLTYISKDLFTFFKELTKVFIAEPKDNKNIHDILKAKMSIITVGGICSMCYDALIIYFLRLCLKNHRSNLPSRRNFGSYSMYQNQY